MKAYKIGKHRYCLVDEPKTDECYRRRKEIGEWGGHFNRVTKRWECSYECAVALDADFIFKVKLAPYCHIREVTEDLATEYEVEAGIKERCLCLCDGHGAAKIIEVLGEAESK